MRAEVAEQAVDPADVPGEVASLQQGQLKGRQKLLRDGSGLASNGPPVLARGYVLGMAFEGHGHRTRFDDSKNTPSEFRGTGSRGTGSRNTFRGTGFEDTSSHASKFDGGVLTNGKGVP